LQEITTSSFVLTTEKTTDKLESEGMATAKQKRQQDIRVIAGSSSVSTPHVTASLKELFEQRDATKPGSKEEDQAVDRIMEAMFPNSHGTR
jgi:hypothetical protein